MNRTRLVASVASGGLAFLAACNSTPTVTAQNASVEEVAAKVKAAGVGGQMVSPGHWDGTMKITKIEMPGMPAGMQEKMKSVMGEGKTFASCLTPEEAAKPRENFFNAGAKNCRYDRFTMSGGSIDAAMTCAEQGMTRTMTMKGTYGPDAYHMDITSAGSGAGPGAGMSMAMTLDAKRSGACTGTEDKMGRTPR